MASQHDREFVSDETLAQQTRLGDSRAFSTLWERHVKPGYTAARQFGSIAEADDIVAEAYLRIFQAMQSGGGPKGAFRPYLYRTIRNVALSWKAGHISVPLDEAEEIVDDRIDIETSTLENTITVTAFRSLPDRWKDILWYSEVEGMDVADIAPLLGLTPNATAALAYRAREGLKKAWIQSHVSDKRVPHDCRWTTERMGDFSSGALTPRARKRFTAHVSSCARCSIIVEEVEEISTRLAAFLLPAVLGGTVGASLLAERSSEPATSTATMARKNPRTSRKLLTTAASVVAASGIAAGIVVGVIGISVNEPLPEAPSSPEAGEALPEILENWPEPLTPEAPSEPNTDAVIPFPPKPTSPTTPPVLKPTPDTTAPAPPALTSPAQGLLTSNSSPTIEGTGEAGAVVDVRTPSGSGFETIASATVGADGTWVTASGTPLPDGPVTLHVSQVDNAGNRSDPVLLHLVIDTIALPPVVHPLLPNPQYFLPIMSGDAEPLAHVELLDENAFLIASVTSDASGAWSVPLPDPVRDDQLISARQTDQAGNVSLPSSPAASIVFERSVILSPSTGDSIPSTGGAGQAAVELAGVEGMQVQILIDGVPTGNLHTLTNTTIVRTTPPLAVGGHTIGVRYIDADGRLGSLTSVTFVIS